MKRTLLLTLTLAGCGSQMMPQQDPNLLTGFQPPAVADGFTRYYAPIVHDLAPGSDTTFCQWLAAPLDHDVDVLAVAGAQSRSGHHAAVYATKDATQAVGTSRPCTIEDMLAVQFLGAVGGEGNNTALGTLPEGVAFRLPAGQAIMVNSHYINATPSALDAQSVLDIQFTPPSADHQIAGFYVLNLDVFNIPAGGPQMADISCTATHDMNFFMFTDHMHEYGKSAFTDLTRTDGTKTMVTVDPTWSSDKTSNSPYTHFPTSAPMTVKSGDTLHTHCEWLNTTSMDIGFPREMCVGSGFFLPGGNPEEICSKP